MKLIGTTTKYIGHNIPGLRGKSVRIFGVLRGGLAHDVDVDADASRVMDDETLARLGGLTEHDCVDVAQVHHDGRVSFVHCDARAVDLECFARRDLE
jgi:hypothetical protein